jgi:hypothetical protein
LGNGRREGHIKMGNEKRGMRNEKEDWERRKEKG